LFPGFFAVCAGKSDEALFGQGASSVKGDVKRKCHLYLAPPAQVSELSLAEINPFMRIASPTSDK
jgi:hypothetical protein